MSIHRYITSNDDDDDDYYYYYYYYYYNNNNYNYNTSTSKSDALESGCSSDIFDSNSRAFFLLLPSGFAL